MCTMVTVPFIGNDHFPDKTVIPDWFSDDVEVHIHRLGKIYRITDYGVVNDSTLLQTEKIQSLIDHVYVNGGGVVFIPKGSISAGRYFLNRIPICTWRKMQY